MLPAIVSNGKFICRGFLTLGWAFFICHCKEGRKIQAFLYTRRGNTPLPLVLRKDANQTG